MKVKQFFYDSKNKRLENAISRAGTKFHYAVGKFVLNYGCCPPENYRFSEDECSSTDCYSCLAKFILKETEKCISRGLSAVMEKKRDSSEISVDRGGEK